MVWSNGKDPDLDIYILDSPCYSSAVFLAILLKPIQSFEGGIHFFQACYDIGFVVTIGIEDSPKAEIAIIHAE